MIDLTQDTNITPPDQPRGMAELDELDDEGLEGRYQRLRQQYIQTRRQGRQLEAATTQAMSRVGPGTPSPERRGDFEKEGTPEPDAFHEFI